MSDTPPTLEGDDFTQGIALERIADGALLLGHAQGEAVLLARRGDEVFAVGATCTHYGGPLAEGLLVGEAVRCPWPSTVTWAPRAAPSATGARAASWPWRWYTATWRACAPKWRWSVPGRPAWPRLKAPATSRRLVCWRAEPSAALHRLR